MNKSQKYAYWLLLSDYDLNTIDCLIAGERWVYVAYLCQQAVERQLKGMYVYYINAEAPKTHNLSFLFKKVCDSEKFRQEADQARFAEHRAEFLYIAAFIEPAVLLRMDQVGDASNPRAQHRDPGCHRLQRLPCGLRHDAHRQQPLL